MANRYESSRREFIVASALGLLGVARLAQGEEPRSDSELLYVGTYTEGDRADGIFLVQLDTRTGALRRVGAVQAGANPSFLAIHPNGRVLYAVNETEKRDGKATGGVSAFSISGDNGALTLLNEQPSGGGAPCYVSVAGGRAVLVANYVGGNVSLLPIEARGALGSPKTVQHHGTGPNKERQEAPHAHCIVTDPSHRFVLAVDLGIDRVLVYRLDLDNGSLTRVESSDGRLRPGAGPRHLAFHPKLPLAYVANELDSTVTAFRFDKETGALSALGTTSTLPAEWSGTNYPADIHIAPSGRTLYLSNRGHNSIAVFSIGDTSGALALEQTVSTEGDWPRNFSLDPSGRWLLAANQKSGSVVVFARDEQSGRLTPTQQRIALPSPVCLRFRAQAGVTT